MSLLVAALTFGVLTNQPRMSLSSKVSEVLAPATPLALRVFYLFDGLKSLPDEGDAAAAALMGTDARAMRELREQLLTDLPAAIPGISRQLQRQASAQASAFQTAPPSAATAVASGDLPIEIMPLATANTAEPRASSGASTLQMGLMQMPQTLERNFEQLLNIELPPLPPMPEMAELQSSIQTFLANPSTIQLEGVLAEVPNIWREEPTDLAQPAYAVLKERVHIADGTPGQDVFCEYEIRRYSPYSVARTSMHVGGDEDNAGTGVGFNRLASYIFGNNADNESMAMTMPVMLSQKTVSKTKTGSGEQTMSFYMPQNVSRLSGPPLPTDGDVSLVLIPASTMAALRFSGFPTDGAVERARKLLLSQLRQDGIRVKADCNVTVLQYNPPYTLPHKRRNEVVIPVMGYSTDANKAARSAAQLQASFEGGMRMAVEFDH